MISALCLFSLIFFLYFLVLRSLHILPWPSRSYQFFYYYYFFRHFSLNPKESKCERALKEFSNMCSPFTVFFNIYIFIGTEYIMYMDVCIVVHIFMMFCVSVGETFSSVSIPYACIRWITQAQSI